MKEEKKEKKGNVEMILTIIWQAFSLGLLIFAWGHDVGFLKGMKQAEINAAVAGAPPVTAK